MEAPERIWIEDERAEGGDVHIYTDLPELAQQFATSYIRADLLDAHIGAVLEETAKECEQSIDQHPDSNFDQGANFGYRSAADAIRNLRPDALQATARARREARVEGMQAALDIVAAHGWAQQIYEELFDAIEAEERTDRGEGE